MFALVLSIGCRVVRGVSAVHQASGLTTRLTMLHLNSHLTCNCQLSTHCGWAHMAHISKHNHRRASTATETRGHKEHADSCGSVSARQCKSQTPRLQAVAVNMTVTVAWSFCYAKQSGSSTQIFLLKKTHPIQLISQFSILNTSVSLVCLPS